MKIWKEGVGYSNGQCEYNGFPLKWMLFFKDSSSMLLNIYHTFLVVDKSLCIKILGNDCLSLAKWLVIIFSQKAMCIKVREVECQVYSGSDIYTGRIYLVCTWAPFKK